MLDWISNFAKDQGMVAVIAVLALLFSGKVIWGMSTDLTLHVQHDGENNRLLRVICLEGAKDDSWRQACLDSKYDDNRLVSGITANQTAGR